MRSGFEFRYTGFVEVDFNKPEKVLEAITKLAEIPTQLEGLGAEMTEKSTKPANKRSPGELELTEKVDKPEPSKEEAPAKK